MLVFLEGTQLENWNIIFHSKPWFFQGEKLNMGENVRNNLSNLSANSYTPHGEPTAGIT